MNIKRNKSWRSLVFLFRAEKLPRILTRHYEIASRLGGTVVVKAQIHAGGRGKGGGVKLASTPAEAEEIAGKMIGMTSGHPSTGTEGRTVRRVLVEEGLPIKKEFYLGIVVDRGSQRPVIMASPAGGMDIEKVAAETPHLIFPKTLLDFFFDVI